MTFMKFDTLLLHGRAARNPDASGATLPPIHQVSAFAHESAERLEQIFANKAPGFAYTRIANPTVAAFERRVAEIENGVSAVACSSGMAAGAMTLLNILRSGDEIISGSALFGGTLDLLGDLEGFGMRTRFIKNVTADEIQNAMSDRTKVIFAELIGNPGLDVVNLSEVADTANRYRIHFVIDSTTASPALIRPIDFGADIVVHSSSKYINGSGSAISGVIVDGGKFEWDFGRFPALARYKSAGKLAFTARLRQDIWRNFGACLAPQNAYLNCLGLDTLGLRMERMCANALALAESLRQNPDISDVNYPGLEDSPFKALTDSQMKDGMGGAILTLRAGSKARAFALINSLRYALAATNIGDVRTLVIHPASTIYAAASGERRQSAGVHDDLIRVSVGLEDIGDLTEDFRQAIEKSKQ